MFAFQLSCPNSYLIMAAEFGDFKLTILGMLGIYGFERRILDTAKSLIEDDTFYTMSLLRGGPLMHMHPGVLYVVFVIAYS